MRLRPLRVGFFRFSTWHVVLLISLSLVGCHRHRNNVYYPVEQPGFKLPKKVQGTSDSRVIKMMRNFNRGGVVEVTTIGSNYLISIPSSALFPPQSPQLSWGAYPTLNQVAKFMKEFRKVAVNVTAYSNKYVSVKREQALTLSRAKAVGNYLWSQGIDSRFIFTEGAGSDKPITDYVREGEQSPTSRIEITFRDAIV